MAVSKVNYGGRTLIDLTNDSVTPETLVSGATAHDAAGNRIVGTGNYVPVTRKINGKALSQDITLSAGDVAADASGTAASAVSSHNSNTSAHSDIRQAVSNAANAASTAQTTANAAKAAIPTKTSQLTNDSGFKTTDTNTTYTFATGDSNGQIKVTPSGGSAQNVSVKGLGSAAYTASTAYDAAGAASGVQTNLNSHTGNKSNPHGVTAAQVGAVTPGGNHTFTGKNIFTAGSSYNTTDTQKFIVGDSNSAFVFGSDGMQCFRGTSSTVGKEFYINYYGGSVQVGDVLNVSTNSTDTPLNITSNTTSTYIGFKSPGTVLGYYGVNANKQPVFYDTKDNAILHAGNVSNYAAPKYQYSTTDLTAGSSSLADGILYFVYE